VRYVCHQTDSRIRISKLSLSVFCLSRPAAPASGRGKSGAKKPRFGGAKSFHEPTPQTKRQTGVCTPVPRCADRDRVSLCRADAVPPHASLIAAYPAAAQGAHTARPRHETFASSSPKKRPSPWGPRNTTAELTDRCGCMHGCSRTHRHTGTQALTVTSLPKPRWLLGSTSTPVPHPPCNVAVRWLSLQHQCARSLEHSTRPHKQHDAI
jgi:hypothetical protein